MLEPNNSTSGGTITYQKCMEVSRYEVILKLGACAPLPTDSISYKYLNFYCIAVQYCSSYTIYQHSTGHWQKYVWNVATMKYAYQKHSTIVVYL